MLYAEISDILDSLEDKSKCFTYEFSDASELQSHLMELKDLVKKERNEYIVSSITYYFISHLSDDGFLSNCHFWKIGFIETCNYGEFATRSNDF